MDEKQGKAIADEIFKGVFGVDNPMTMEEMSKRLAYDVALPKRVRTLDGGYTWSSEDVSRRILSQFQIEERARRGDEFMMQKKQIKSAAEVMELWKELNINTGDRHFKSTEVAESDEIYNSSNIFRCVQLWDTSNMVLCSNIAKAKYLLASHDTGMCEMSVRVSRSEDCSYCYDVKWTARASNCFMVYGCTDLHECIACYQIKSMKYCIANMQFEKDEYFKIKKLVIDYLINSFKGK